MAVCTRLRFNGATPGQSESIHTHLNVEVDPPEGLILHTAGPVDGGWAMFDVWESHAAFERFTETRALPARSIPEAVEMEEFATPELVQPDRMTSAILR